MSLANCSGYAAFIMEDGSVMAFGDMNTEQPTIQSPKIITIPTGEKIVDMKKSFYAGYYKHMLFLTEGGDLWSYTLHVENDKLKKIEMPFPIKFIRITHAINGRYREFVLLDKYRNIYVLQLNRDPGDGSYYNIIKVHDGSEHIVDCGATIYSGYGYGYYDMDRNSGLFANVLSTFHINSSDSNYGFFMTHEKNGNFKFSTRVSDSIDCFVDNVKECYYSDYFKYNYNVSDKSFLENFYSLTIKTRSDYIYGAYTIYNHVYPTTNICIGYLKEDGKLYVHGFNISNITGEGASEDFVKQHLIPNQTFKNVDLVSYARNLNNNTTPAGYGCLYEHCFVGITTDNKIKAWGKDPTGIIIPQSVQDSWGY